MRSEEWWCGAKNYEAPRSINRAMPEGLLIAGFPFGISYHRPMKRERKRFLTSFEMTIRESLMSPSLLVSSHLLRFHTDDTEAGEAQDGEAPAGEVDVIAHLRDTFQIGKDEAGDGRAFIFSCKIDLQPV